MIVLDPVTPRTCMCAAWRDGRHLRRCSTCHGGRTAAAADHGPHPTPHGAAPFDRLRLYHWHGGRHALANPLANDTPAPDVRPDQEVCAPQPWRWDHTAIPHHEEKAQVSDLRRDRRPPKDRHSTPLPGVLRSCRRGDLNLPSQVRWHGRERQEWQLSRPFVRARVAASACCRCNSAPAVSKVLAKRHTSPPAPSARDSPP